MANALTWEVVVDWDADGNFTGPYDDISADVMAIDISAGRSGSTDRFAPATCTLTIDNGSGRYTRTNASSPLYGLIRANREVRVRVTYNAVTYARFRGYLGDMAASWSLNGVPRLAITCGDGLERWQRALIRLALQESKRVDQLLTTVLDAIGWDAGMRDLDTALTTIAYYAAMDRPGVDELMSLAEQEMGQAWVAPDGDFTFRNRLARSIEPVHGTLAHCREVSVGYRLEDLIDSARLQWAGLVLSNALQAVFELTPDGRRLKPGSTDPQNVIEAAYDYPAVKNPATPASGTDFNAESADDGTGTSKTAQLSVASFTSFGEGFRIVWANADSSPIYLFENALGDPGFQVRGYPVRRFDEGRTLTVAAPTPPGSGQVYERELPWNNDADEVASMASLIANVLSAEKARPEVELDMTTDADMAFAIGIDVGKRVTLALSGAGFAFPPALDGDYFVEAFTLHLEPETVRQQTCRLTLWPEDHAFGTAFRVSPDEPAAILSAIDGPDRIWV